MSRRARVVGCPAPSMTVLDWLTQARASMDALEGLSRAAATRFGLRASPDLPDMWSIRPKKQSSPSDSWTMSPVRNQRVPSGAQQ